MQTPICVINRRKKEWHAEIESQAQVTVQDTPIDFRSPLCHMPPSTLKIIFVVSICFTTIGRPIHHGTLRPISDNLIHTFFCLFSWGHRPTKTFKLEFSSWKEPRCQGHVWREAKRRPFSNLYPTTSFYDKIHNVNFNWFLTAQFFRFWARDATSHSPILKFRLSWWQAFGEPIPSFSFLFKESIWIEFRIAVLLRNTTASNLPISKWSDTSANFEISTSSSTLTSCGVWFALNLHRWIGVKWIFCFGIVSPYLVTVKVFRKCLCKSWGGKSPFESLWRCFTHFEVALTYSLVVSAKLIVVFR